MKVCQVILRNPKIHHHIRKARITPCIRLILQSSPHLQPYVYKIHFNIIFLPKRKPPHVLSDTGASLLKIQARDYSKI
jgi:hypothetical protein